MNEDKFNQLISDLADWIDVEVLSQNLVESLEKAYIRYDIEGEITLSVLKEFYLSLLGNIDENARYFVDVDKESDL